MKKNLVLLALLVFSVGIVSAASTCLTVQSKTTLDYLNEISSLNQQLSSCTISVQSNVYSLIGDGNVKVTINMNDGSTESFYVTVTNQVVSQIVYGNTQSYSYEVILSEQTMDDILDSNDAFNDILKHVNNGNIKVKASSFLGSIKWFFAKFFLPTAQTTSTQGQQQQPTQQTPAGKPDYCDETYIPGHKGYQENKDLWDQYSRDTDNACQSQYGRGVPSPCVHTVQLSVSGNPYYLCWYNE